jgi:tetratricopeptide (TPR) repeat protein
MERRKRRALRAAFVWVALASVGLAGSASASSVMDLVLEARELEAAHQEDRAIRRYTEALELDPTCAPAYLGLADLRARRGDTREAERVYSVALSHVPGLYAALVGRARVRRVLGAAREGNMDLELYLNHEEDLAAMKELATWYADDGRPAAALATWRRIFVTTMRAGADPALVREAKATVRALQLLVSPADPVVAPADTDPVRQGMARIARRGG